MDAVRLRGAAPRLPSAGTGQPLEVIDFGHSPIFPDADTFPCILILAKRGRALTENEGPGVDEKLSACEVPRDHWSDRMDLGAFVLSRRRQIATCVLRREGWSLEVPRAQDLLEKLRSAGTPLKEMFDSRVYRGPVTGLNEAFIIDDAARRELIAEDENSAQILKPLLRGRDVDRWLARQSNLYLIFSNKGIDIDQYPAIKRHLARFRTRLEPKPRELESRHDQMVRRKFGDYHWYELQDPVSEDFNTAMCGAKILYQEIQYHSWFCLESDGAFVNNKVFMITSSNIFLLAILNSPLMWWQLSRVLPHMKDEALCPASFMMEAIQFPEAREGISEAIEPITRALLKLSGSFRAWEAELSRQPARYCQTRKGIDESCHGFHWKLTYSQKGFVNLVVPNNHHMIS